MLGQCKSQHRRNCISDLPKSRVHRPLEYKTVWETLESSCFADTDCTSLSAVIMNV